MSVSCTVTCDTAAMHDRQGVIARPPQQRLNLNTQADDHIFVRSTGTVMTTRNTKRVIQDMAHMVGVLEPEKYSEYSLRVGGATHCTAAGIPDGLMYRYVGWDPSRLPDSGRRYVRPPSA
jgi:hypothetical protein